MKKPNKRPITADGEGPDVPKVKKQKKSKKAVEEKVQVTQDGIQTSAKVESEKLMSVENTDPSGKLMKKKKKKKLLENGAKHVTESASDAGEKNKEGTDTGSKSTDANQIKQQKKLKKEKKLKQGLQMDIESIKDDAIQINLQKKEKKEKQKKKNKKILHSKTDSMEEKKENMENMKEEVQVVDTENDELIYKLLGHRPDKIATLNGFQKKLVKLSLIRADDVEKSADEIKAITNVKQRHRKTFQEAVDRGVKKVGYAYHIDQTVSRSVKFEDSD